MTTAHLEHRKKDIIEHIVLLHYKSLLDCDILALRTKKFKAYFDISEFIENEDLIFHKDLESLFFISNTKYKVKIPETCVNLKEIEILKRGKSYYLVVKK